MGHQEVGLSFRTIYATPNFRCPKCGKPSNHYGFVEESHDPVWECGSCKCLFKPILRVLHYRTKVTKNA